VSDLPVPTTDRDGRRWSNLLRDVLRRIDRIESTSDVPTPAMVWWPSELSPPPGWVRGGAELSRQTYGGLFAKVGTSGGGGNGMTTFNAPNLATPLAAVEAERYVGDTDQPVFENGWVNFGGGNGTARFWRDPLGGLPARVERPDVRPVPPRRRRRRVRPGQRPADRDRRHRLVRRAWCSRDDVRVARRHQLPRDAARTARRFLDRPGLSLP
jgi:hypothetical protein